MNISCLAKAVALLDASHAPACITDMDGTLIFVNRPMKAVMRSSGERVFRCRWLTDEPGRTCPDCAEAPTLQGRCFFAREDGVFLDAAVRIFGSGGALARIYFRSKTGGNQETVDKLLSLAVSPAKNRLDEKTIFPPLPELRAVAHSAIAAAGMTHDVDNGINQHTLCAEWEPLELRCVITQILRHLWLVGVKGKIAVRDISADALAGYSAPAGLAFNMHTQIYGKKELKSRLGALGFRLGNYFHLLRQATQTRLRPPDISHHKKIVVVKLDLSDPAPRPDADQTHEYEFSGLSSRELEVLELTRLGHDNQSISSVLKISESTVRQHLKSLYRKAGVKNRLALILKSWRDI